MYKLRYTPGFIRDFETIRGDILTVSGSSVIADRYKREFAEKIKKKQKFPQSAIPLYHEEYFTGFYFVHFRAYNAFYVIRDEYMELVRALPSKSDYMRILFGEYYTEDLGAEDELQYLNE